MFNTLWTFRRSFAEAIRWSNGQTMISFNREAHTHFHNNADDDDDNGNTDNYTYT